MERYQSTFKLSRSSNILPEARSGMPIRKRELNLSFKVLKKYENLAAIQKMILMNKTVILITVVGLAIVVGLTIILVMYANTNSLNTNSLVAPKDDKFGITEIYPSAGREWYANWDNRSPVEIPGGGGGSRDPQDPETLVTGIGRGTVMGDGRFKLEGDASRLHIIDKDASRELKTVGNSVSLWKNTEVTAYFFVEHQNQTIDEDKGIGIEARLGDYVGNYLPDMCQTPESEGDALGYSYNTFMRYNGSRTGVQKEIKDEGMYTDGVGDINPFGSGDMPLHKWFGLKLVTVNYNDDKNVKLEVWFDQEGNNHWRKIIEFRDDGHWRAGDQDGENANNCLQRPDNMVITWGTPDVRIRADFADPVYLKNVSVREIRQLT
jgi:hypothetical protein